MLRKSQNASHDPQNVVQIRLQPGEKSTPMQKSCQNKYGRAYDGIWFQSTIDGIPEFFGVGINRTQTRSSCT